MNQSERRRLRRTLRRQAAEVATPTPQIKALVDQGLERHRIGDIDNALAAYARALSIDPGNAEANYYCGIALHQAGRSGDATAHLETAVAAAPDEASYHFDLANLREANGRPDLAEATHRALCAQRRLHLALGRHARLRNRASAAREHPQGEDRDDRRRRFCSAIGPLASRNGITAPSTILQSNMLTFHWRLAGSDVIASKKGP